MRISWILKNLRKYDHKDLYNKNSHNTSVFIDTSVIKAFISNKKSNVTYGWFYIFITKFNRKEVWQSCRKGVILTPLDYIITNGWIGDISLWFIYTAAGIVSQWKQSASKYSYIPDSTMMVTNYENLWTFWHDWVDQMDGISDVSILGKIVYKNVILVYFYIFFPA